MLTRRQFLRSTTAIAAGTAASMLPVAADDAFRITVNPERTLGRCDPAMWSNIGYDPMYAATVAGDSQPFWKIVEATRALRYVRCHNTFSDAAPGARPERVFGCRVFRIGASGRPVYDWRYLDRVLDTWRRAGLRPIIETSYMPDALAEGEIVRNYSGGAINPPNNYALWRDLVSELIRHVEQRYGAEEVRTWCFEVWNEPDLAKYFVDGRSGQEAFQPGMVERFCRLYDYFVEGALAADPEVRVGGPGLAGWTDFLMTFLNHVTSGRNFANGRTGTRIDFISWHGYGSTETLREKNRRMRGAIRAEFPGLENVEMHMNEWGQELDDDSNRPSCYTEYEAAFLCRLLDLTFNDRTARVARLVRWGNLTSGWRSLARNHGGTVIPMPIFNAYDLLARLEGEWVEVLATGAGRRAGTLAAKSAEGLLNVLVYHFDEARQEGGGASLRVSVSVSGVTKRRLRVRHYRVDREHGNAYRAWQAMASPEQPSVAQVKLLAESAQLKPMAGPASVAVRGRAGVLEFDLPVNAVSLLTFG